MSTALLDAGVLPLSLLADRGDAPALVTGAGTLTYADLAGRVRDRVERLGPVRRLVMVAAGNDVEPLVTYLAALVAGHPVLLVPGDAGRPADDANRSRLLEAYAPDVVLEPHGGGWELRELREGTGHDLHPDLALLLSTSGSTGSPKLVRLSRENVRANAEAIVSALGITADDRAATTLPFHYSYGLSVVNSHLLAGASLLLTDRSVSEDAFWEEARAHGVTSFAGVPYTFELLDASGFAERDLPPLRQVTAAGGRLAPEAVRRFAALGRERGFDLVVMYGQTEATARMAYLPPHLADRRPGTIGVPVPGGSFRIEPPCAAAGSCPGRGCEHLCARDPGGTAAGELVYAGPNVMLGYASTPADLAKGREVRELRTGDLAVQHEDGLYEIVGRRSRFAKVFGLRLDLDRVEEALAGTGVRARAVGAGDRLAVFVRRRFDVATAGRALTRLTGLPAHAVRVHVVEEFPLTGNGKPDHAALVRHAQVLEEAIENEADAGADRRAPRSVDAARVRDLYAAVLGRPEATEDDSFVALHGDSLSFVEVSVRLGELLGSLPRDWQDLSPRALVADASVPAASPAVTGSPALSGSADSVPAQRRRTISLDTPVLLRAISIVLIVGSHANLLSVMGGAHLLLGLAGFNLARFQLADVPRASRVRSLLGALRQVLVPSVAWIGGVALVTGYYDLPTVLMANGLFGSDSWTVQWQFWFLEALVWSLAGVAALMAVPWLDARERARPFGFALTVLAVTTALRYALVGVEAGPTERYAVPVVLWSIALGWVAARASTTRQRLLTSVLAVASVAGFFGDPVREGLVAAGLLLVLWVPALPVPVLVARLAGTVASASLFVYLTHWQVYPHLEDHYPLLATLSSFAVGIAAWRLYARFLARFVR